MQFRVNLRDGPARCGQFLYNEERIVTPNIFFLQTPRCPAPVFADILLTDSTENNEKKALQIGKSVFSSGQNKALQDICVDDYLLYPKDVSLEMHEISAVKNKNADCCLIPAKKKLIPEFIRKNDAVLFIVANAKQLFSQQTEFIDFITELRERIGYQKLIYLPSIGNPMNFSFLTYLGIDFFDSFYAQVAARNETLLFPTGVCKKDILPECPCHCPTCVTTTDVTTMGYEDVLHHNYYMLLDEIRQVRNAIIGGSLRELVETRVRMDPHLASLLRVLDLKYYEYLEERTPTSRKQPLIATTKDALARPEIRRFQERVLDRFVKPASTRILLLLPCSAKKPYSFSKSHKRFRECLLNSPNPFTVHEVIITSPLGIVPRELELLYPASTYDIAVTGHWDEDEKKMIRTLLKGFLRKNNYDATIIHLPETMQDFLCDLFKDPHVTCKQNPTSVESLATLSRELAERTSHAPELRPTQRFYENVFSLACYQFGPTLAALLMQDCTIKGKYPYQKIMLKNTQLGMLTEERGCISLTMAGAQRLLDSEQYWVEISDDFVLKGSVFAPGIQHADGKIRIGDEVLVKKHNKLCGVGVALMNGAEMIQATQGEAVKIRHHI
jgi:archaeosine synthase